VFNSFNQLIKRAQGGLSKTIAVAVAQDIEVLEAIKEARELGLIEAILIGNQYEIEDIAKKIKLDLDKFTLIHEEDNDSAVRQAVVAVSTRRADMVMKGAVGTASVLKAVLDKEYGLRKGRILSHVAFFEAPGYNRIMLLTDAGMNIAPSFEQKIDILNNVIDVAHSLGIERPKVAALAGLELVNPSMPATVDAALLAKMSDRGQIKGAIVDGPLALDLAVSEEAGKLKGVNSEVVGKADILFVPNLETGNVLYKSLVYFANARMAGIVAGAKAPIIITSRSDSHKAKLVSIALGVLIIDQNKKG